jgi:mannose-6-phosphate isomerase-like protein (cupin superfamily)
MRHIKTGSKRGFFKVLASSDSAQAAMMVLRPGQKSGEEIENEHPNAEQWLFVVSGTGTAHVGKRRLAIADNSLLLIEKGEAHQIENTGRRRPLITLNLYVPPAYGEKGEVRLVAKGLARAVADAIRGE